MTVTGMDVLGVRELCAAMAKGGEELTLVHDQLRSSLSATPWQGSDADVFQDDWHSRHAPALLTVVRALGEVAKALDAETRDQLDASDDTAGGSGGGGGGSTPAGGSDKGGLSGIPGVAERVVDVLNALVAAGMITMDAAKAYATEITAKGRAGLGAIDSFLSSSVGSKLLTTGKAVPYVGVLFDAVAGGRSQYAEDAHYPPGERMERALAAAVAAGAFAVGVDALTTFGTPLLTLGVNLGIVGIDAGTDSDRYPGGIITDTVTDVAAGTVSAVRDAREWAVDTTIDIGRDLWRDMQTSDAWKPRPFVFGAWGDR